MEVIRGDMTTAGDFVLRSQKLATAEGFRTVSKTWFEKTRRIADEIERLAATRSRREEFAVSFRNLTPVVRDGRFALGHRGRTFYLDHYTAGQLGGILEIGAVYPQKLIEDGTPESAEMMLKAFDHAAVKVDQGSAWVFRVEDEKLLRGILPEASNYIPNEWYLRVIERALPGGRLSHWRGDDWTIYGNVLIPDTIRQESDSEYGAMVSVSNCEIGKRALGQRPSLFRAICMNGCIWGRTLGEAFSFNRRAKLDQGELEKALQENIREQIPIATAGISQLLARKKFETAVPMKPVIATVARELELSRRLASAVLTGWWLEKRETPELSNTLFALVNAITRAGQAEGNEAWVCCDEIGGALAQMPRSKWEDLVSRAAALRARDVDGAFAPWALAI